MSFINQEFTKSNSATVKKIALDKLAEIFNVDFQKTFRHLNQTTQKSTFAEHLVDTEHLPGIVEVS